MKTEMLVIFMVLLIVGQPVAQFLLKKSYQMSSAQPGKATRCAL